MAGSSRRDDRAVVIGHDAAGASVSVPMSVMRATSTHIIGASGYGKSFLLRNTISQFVRMHQPFGIVDPHGEVAEFALWRLRRAGVPPERIVLLDPSDDAFSMAFNPLACGVTDAAETTGLVLDAFLKAWGARSMDETPRLEGTLRGTLRLLIDGGLTLVEAYDVLNADNVSLRRALCTRVTDRYVRADFEEIDKLSRTDRLAALESTRNRLRRFLHAAPLQRMFAQTKNTIDFRQVLDQGQFLIVNLAGVTSPETQRLLGALVMNAIYHAAKRRDSRHRRGWFLMVDEFGEFATRDFAASLDQLRKYGCHMVLAHQRLAQLSREDEDVLSAVMTNAKIKLVFGGLPRGDAEIMARELYTGAVTGDEVKHVGYATKFRPIFDTFTVETGTWSGSDSESDSWSTGSTSSESTTVTEGTGFEAEATVGEPVEPDTLHYSRSTSKTESSGYSNTSGGSRGTSRTRGGSRSVVPITRHEEFREETSRQFRSIEEQWERHVADVHALGPREVLVRVLNGQVVKVRTADVPGELVDNRFVDFQREVFEASPHAIPSGEVAGLIEQRQRDIRAMIDQTDEKAQPFKVRSFRE